MSFVGYLRTRIPLLFDSLVGVFVVWVRLGPHGVGSAATLLTHLHWSVMIICPLGIYCSPVLEPYRDKLTK
jgi:hypothetical protein